MKGCWKPRALAAPLQGAMWSPPYTRRTWRLVRCHSRKCTPHSANTTLVDSHTSATPNTVLAHSCTRTPYTRTPYTRTNTTLAHAYASTPYTRTPQVHRIHVHRLHAELGNWSARTVVHTALHSHTRTHSARTLVHTALHSHTRTLYSANYTRTLARTVLALHSRTRTHSTRRLHLYTWC
jgi:hypothetical protein